MRKSSSSRGRPADRAFMKGRRALDKPMAHARPSREYVRLQVFGRADALTAAALARRAAFECGAHRRQAASAAIVAAELVQNIVDHAGGSGELVIRLEGESIVIEARDHGPGLPDPSVIFLGSDARMQAGLRAGFGLGEGGSAIKRLVDEVDARANGDRGLVVTARMRLRD